MASSKKTFAQTWLNLNEWVEWMGQWGVSRALVCSILFVGEYLILVHLIPNLPLFTISWIFGTLPIWLPVGLLIGFWMVWVWYIQSLFISGRNPILLEMKIPREITKSPRAMEIAFSSFWLSSGETTFLQRGWKGQIRPFFSFEIASFGGEVHFYVWCWKNYEHTVQEAIYGMYPEVELIEVEDYSKHFHFDPKVHSAYATEWRLESPRAGGRTYGGGAFPREDAYPIKTYIDFELDKDPKEEFKVDPLASIVEFMGSIHSYEQLWVQFVIRRCGKYNILFTNERDDEWKHMVQEEVEKVREEASILTGDAITEAAKEAGRDLRFPRPTPRQTHTMEALDRNMSKQPFEFVGRGIYLSTHGLHGPTFTHMRWMWKPMGNSAYLSHLRPRRWHNPFDYPWQDVNDYRWNLTIRRFIDAYRRRMAFHAPWILPANVMTNEGLATIWRPPSSSAASPGLQRIPATKAEPPPNLPK